ncbi:tetratricopeptide repeat protein [Acidipila sp. EB88]|uniref:tetratricopeptide repeat protein n=1 Tax=Acidipila sp. EB88 TaxID=2305226 RepID=UPI00131556C1|nr:tetratricopeptide repeat protein [Acidipila sp. EB88]
MNPTRSSAPHPSAAAPSHLLAFASSVLIGALLCAGAASAQTRHTPATPARAAAATPVASTPAKTPASSSTADAYYHSMLAHGYEEQALSGGQPEFAGKAIEEYQAALAADPESPTLGNQLAELYFRTGRVKDAIEAAQAHIARDPNSLDAHKLLGRIYLRSLGDGSSTGNSQMLQLAIAEYTKIVALEPGSIEDHLLLGQLYSFAKDAPHAQEQFAAAQKIDPHSEEVVLNMARIDTEQNNIRGAIQVLSSLPEADQTAKTEYALGASYDQVKETKHAITAYQKSLSLEEDNLDVERALADALHRDGQDKAALAAYNDVIDGDPTDASAYLHAAEIERTEGRLDEALANLKKAAPLASDSLEIRYNEALVYDQLGSYGEAERLLTKMVADAEHSTGDYSPAEKNNYALFVEHLAGVYQEEGKTDDAIANYNKLIALGGDFALGAYAAEVDTYREAHQYDKATGTLQQAVAKNPKNRSLKLALALQLSSTGKYDDGINLAKTLLNNSPQDREVYLTLSQIQMHARKWKDAGESLDKADQQSTSNEQKVAVLLQRAVIEDRQKHNDAADADYNKALAIDPNNSLVLNNYGYMLADRGARLNDALAMIQKAVKLDPQNYANLDSLGWAYFKLGQYALAENNLLRASQRSTQDPTVHEHLGDLYEKTNRLKQAASQWEESLRLYSKTDPGDAEPGEGPRLQKKLDTARVKLAKEMPPPAQTDKQHP